MIDKKKEKLIEIILFFLSLGCFFYAFPRWADPNQNSRLDLVFAVVEDRTFQIDKYVHNTVDYAKVGEHYYSDKAPGTAFIGIPIYAVLRVGLQTPIVENLVSRLESSASFRDTLNPEGSGAFGEKVKFAIAQVIIAFFVSALPTSLITVLLFRLFGYFDKSFWYRFLAAFSYAILTPAFPYANAFYGHQLSAALVFVTFFIGFTKSSLLPLKSAFLGFLLAYSVITEYPVFILAALVFFYICYRLINQQRTSQIVWVVIAGGAVALGWMIYNKSIFGGFFNLGYSYSELWVDQHHTGFMSLAAPKLEAIWGITFSPFRGLFFYSPILLLGLIGFFRWLRDGSYRLEAWVSLACVLGMFVFNSASGMWWGGFAIGPRYILPMLPFLCLASCFAITAVQRSFWARVLTLGLMAWSFVIIWGLTFAGQAFPPDTLQNPIIEYGLLNWREGNIARNLGTIVGLRTYWSLLPLLIYIFIGCMLAYKLSIPILSIGEDKG